MRQTALTLCIAIVLAGAALLSAGGVLSGAPRWTPDALFYQARTYEIRGMEQPAALTRAFQGPLGSALRRIDPERSAKPAWVAYNAQFYQRRVLVPAAAAALTPVAGDRAILDVSLAGYVAAVLAVFALLLLRFRPLIAGAVALATVFVPALVQNSSVPLTDSWGLALEAAAFAFGLLALERGPRWLLGWFASILVLSFTRDSMWIPILAAIVVALRVRSRLSIAMVATGIAAAIPVVLAFPMPIRPLLAEMLNGIQPAPGAGWGFVAHRYPGAMIDMLHADGGFIRGGAWYTAAYLAAGVVALFWLSRGARASQSALLLKAGAVAGVLYVLAVPVFSAFRLELTIVPMAAFGLALAAERIAARAALPEWVAGRPLLSGRSAS